MLTSLIRNPTASCSALDNPYKPAHGRHISRKENKRHWHLLSCQQSCCSVGRLLAPLAALLDRPRALLRQASACLCPRWGEVGVSVWSQDPIKAGHTVRGAGPCGGYGFLLPELWGSGASGRCCAPVATDSQLAAPRSSPEQPEVGWDPFHQASAGRGTRS